jgi:hypothetical protein
MAAQRDAQARLQLANAKGFTEIVIGAGIQRGNFIVLFGAGRQHDNRHLAPLAHVANKINAVAIRQAEIEDDQVRLAGCGFNKPRCRVSASNTRMPSASSAVRRKRRIACSSSIIRTLITIPQVALPVQGRFSRQCNTERRRPRPVAGGDGPAVDVDDGLTDGKAQPDARDRRLFCRGRIYQR